MTLHRYRVCYIDGYAQHILARTIQQARLLAYAAHYAGVDSITPAPAHTIGY